MVWRVVVVVDECDDDERAVDWRRRIAVQVVVEQMIVLPMVPPFDVGFVETWLMMMLLWEQCWSRLLLAKRMEELVPSYWTLTLPSRPTYFSQQPPFS